MRRILLLAVLAAFVCPAVTRAESHEYDVVVYGGTSAGVTAAVQASRMGKSVVLIDPGDYVGLDDQDNPRYVSHLGGLSSGGLGDTDVGDASAIGGMSYDFYRREDILGGGSGWSLHADEAEQVYDAMVKEAGVTVRRLQRLDRSSGVSMTGGRIDSISTLGGQTYNGSMFIDATYEGDLMAAADVSYTVGREARSTYDEHFNGIAYDKTRHHIFDNTKVDPYVVKGDPTSGLLPGVQLSQPDPAGNGAEDNRIQAYCYRLNMTTSSNNRKNWTELWGANGENPPAGYDRQRYELHHRFLETGKKLRDVMRISDSGIGGNKNDVNNWGPVSTDFIGGNYDVYVPSTDRTVNFAEANYEEREYIIDRHIEYTKGFLYYLAFDSPENIQSSMASWGLCKDEFTDNENFPHQLYIREARRMEGEYVMSEKNTRNYGTIVDVPAGTEIGLGSYAMDSHNTHRYVREDGTVEVEGNFWLGGDTRTYSIAYGAITPKQAEAINLLVPAAFSASHTAFGSMRMEPVFMVLGQSAGTAAVLAIDSDGAVQEIDMESYQALMRQYGQKLTDNDEPTETPFQGMVREDFNYGPDANRLEAVSYIEPGWSEHWQADSADPKYTGEGNLKYQGAYYTNSTAPAHIKSGSAGDGSGQRSGHIAIRGIRGGMQGQAWMTALVKVSTTTDGEAILWLDGVDSDDAMGIAEGGALELLGEQTAANLADGEVHLLLAKLNIAAGNDSIELWIDPDAGNLGTADLQADGADLFGDSLDLLGISVGEDSGAIDAIRLSNAESAFVDVLGLVIGDADGDGTVTSADADRLRANYGTTSGAQWGDGDFDLDGDVDFNDAWIWLSVYEGDSAGEIDMAYLTNGEIPEPTTISLLILGAGGLLARRRRR
ncbi:MAG: FAD-dependent oxidoreductase [Phycisphaerae bacterium]